MNLNPNIFDRHTHGFKHLKGVPCSHTLERTMLSGLSQMVSVLFLQRTHMYVSAITLVNLRLRDGLTACGMLEGSTSSCCTVEPSATGCFVKLRLPSLC